MTAPDLYDRDFFESRGGDSLQRGTDAYRALRKASTVRGMDNFPQTADGRRLPAVEGPSGDTLEAELQIDRVIPASKRR